MTWLALAGSILVTASIILLPGWSLAAILGMRGLWAWALAGPFGMSVTVIAAVLAPIVGLPWGLLPVVGVFAVIALCLLVARLVFGGLRTQTVAAAAGPRWAAPAGIGIAAVLLAAQLVRVIQAPGNISQTFDNIFHLNAVRFVLDTANASPFHVGSMTSETGALWFYPSGWHALVALVVELTGVDIPVATNALAITLSCLLWPAGAMLLTRTVFGASRSVILCSGVMAAALPTMPLLMLDYGVLYPYALGLSLVPAMLAAMLTLLRMGEDATARVAWVWTVVVLGGLPALALVHPGAFMAWLVLASVGVLISFVEFLRVRPTSSRRLVAGCVGFSAYVAAAFVLWRVLRPALDARSWPPTLTLGQGIGEALTLSYWGGAIPAVAVGAVVVGVTAAARRRRPHDTWVLFAVGTASILYVAAIGFPWPSFRDLLTAAWYNNAPRLAAIVPVFLVPLAAAGLSAVWNLYARGRHARSWRAPIAALALVLLVVVTQVGAVPQAVREASERYALTNDSVLVSADEMTLLRRLSREVPEDAVIAGSPWTGTSVAYAISGRRVLMPHTLMDVDEDTQTINDELDEAATTPEVCAALERKGVQFVLDFGDREVHGARNVFSGFDSLATSPAVELVDAQGEAALYRVVACG